LGFLSMAGFQASESMAALPSVLALATAGGLELASAADIASNVISGFGKEAADAAEVADVLAVAASTTNTNVGQLGQAMSTVAPIAAAMGISMQATAASIGVMSDAGIQGERAGTALRGVFASLAGPTSQAADALAKYGLTVADVNPETNDLADILDKLKERGLSTADAMTIFGREAASGALVMVEASERVRELTGEFGNAEGAAAKMAKTMGDNLSGDLKSMSSAIEGIILKLGDSGATGAFRTLTQVATGAIRSLTDNMNTLITVVSTAAIGFGTYKIAMLAGSAATVLMSGNLGIYIGAVSTVTARLGIMAGAQVAMTSATAGAAAAFRVLTEAMIKNPFTAVAVAIGVVASAMFVLSQRQREARAETDNLIRSLRGLAQARSADFALAKSKVEMERNQAQSRLMQLQNQERQLGTSPELAQRGGTSGRLSSIRTEAQQLRWDLVKMNSELGLADKAYKQAGAAAASMEVPVAQTAAAASGAAASTDGLSKSLGTAKKMSDEFGDSMGRLLDRLFPTEAKIADHAQDYGLLSLAFKKGAIDADRYADAVARLDQQLRDSIYGEVGPNQMVTAGTDASNGLAAITGDDLQEALFKAGVTTENFADKARNATVNVAKSFKDMADNTLAAIDRMVSSIQGGGFLNILSSVIGLGMQLGSIGAFGSKIQANINKTPGRATGGAVSAGQSYLVGENRPEIFTPGANGFISPKAGNDNGPMNITVEASPYFDVRVNGQIAQSAPTIAQGGAQLAMTRSSRAQSRSVR
jgi:TP901 family phage tail tape measure protein